MFRNAQAMTLPYGGRSWPDRTTLYDFLKLPETEAQADANNFVCETNNASAGGNETGVGGGLSGADLVLIQGGTMPGAVSGWRTVTDRAAMYLQATQTFFKTFFESAPGWSALWKLRNINTTGDTSTGPMLLFVSEDAGKVFMRFQRSTGAYATMGAIASGAGARPIGIFPNSNHADFGLDAGVPLYLLTSVDYARGLIFSSLSKYKQPTSLDDCLTYHIAQPKAALTALSGLAFTGTYRYLIGCAGSFIANGCDIASITFAKYPSVTLK